MKDSKELFKNPYVVSISIVLALIILFSGIFAGLAALKKDSSDTGTSFRTFGSCGSMARYINQKRPKDIYPPMPFEDVKTISEGDVAESAPNAPTASDAGRGSDEYSQTNIQVEGVDEADVIKTDGEYIYTLSTDYSSDSRVSIVNAKDPSNLVIEGDIELDTLGTEMFLNGNKLLIFANDYYSSPIYLERNSYLTRNVSDVLIYDISDKADPELETSYKLQGSYNTSRMIGDYVYLVSNSYFYDYSATDVTSSDVKKYIPLIADGENPNDTYKPMAECSEISYYGTNINSFVSITAFPLNGEEVKSKVILGDSGNIYMSDSNLYLSTVVYDNGEYDINDEPFREDYTPEITSQIFKIAVDKNNFEFKASGEVSGTTLNQFSMDEYYDYFRIATTTNDWGGWRNDSRNNLYVLDKDLKQVGAVEDLARGEQIYSVRFMGDRAFMVTFRQTDPLFAIDLKDPMSPKVVGELKIPGFSDYLHPYDENNLIGIGKNADEKTGRAKGLKVAIFDISDMNSPKVKSEVLLGDETYNSEALMDHKAFLFEKDKGLMVIPMNSYEYNTVARVSTIENIIKDLGLTSMADSVSDTRISFTFAFLSIEQRAALEDKLKEAGLNAAYLENVEGAVLLNYDLNAIGFAVFDTTDAKLSLREVLNYPTDFTYSFGYKARSLYIGDYLFTNTAGLLGVNKLSDLSGVDLIDLSDSWELKEGVVIE